MRRFLHDINPTARGLLIVALIAVVVVVFQLQQTVSVVGGLLRIAFFLAIAFFVFLVWRERRSDIDTWSQRARAVFYGAVALVVVDLGVLFSGRLPAGLPTLAFVLVLAICGFAMFRVWRDEHTYGG